MVHRVLRHCLKGLRLLEEPGLLVERRGMYRKRVQRLLLLKTAVAYRVLTNEDSRKSQKKKKKKERKGGRGEVELVVEGLIDHEGGESANVVSRLAQLIRRGPLLS